MTTLLSSCASLESADLGSSDQDVRSEVLSRLRADPITGNTAFGVTVENGTVTLTGVMPNANVKMRAVSIAGGTPGVTSVTDQSTRF